MYDIAALSGKLVSELRDIAKQLNIPKHESLKKQELVTKILEQKGGTTATEKAETPKPVKQNVLHPLIQKLQ